MKQDKQEAEKAKAREWLALQLDSEDGRERLKSFYDAINNPDRPAIHSFCDSELRVLCALAMIGLFEIMPKQGAGVLNA